MCIVRLRLQHIGHLHYPKWRIIAQSKLKSYKSDKKKDVHEHLGQVLHNGGSLDRSYILNFQRIRYYISNGAVPTNAVHKVLANVGMLPKFPLPFGNKYSYTKPQKEITLKDFERFRWGLKDVFKYERPEDISKQFDNFIMSRLTELDKLIDNQKNISSLRQSGELNINLTNTRASTYLRSDCDTADIDSDEPDFVRRKRNFEIMSKKVNHFIDNKTNPQHVKELKWHIYIRKLTKLARRNGLDEESHKKFKELIEIENEKNKILKQKLTLKFQTELRNSEEFKKKFFLLFNEGKVDEQMFKDFAEKEVQDIQALINKQVDNYFKLQEEPEEMFSIFSQKEKNKELIQDFVILRFAKLMKKLKEGYLYTLNSETDNNDNENVSKNNVTLEITNKLDKVGEKIKREYLTIVDNEFVDKELFKLADKKFKQDKGLHAGFYSKVNEVLLKSKTFKKFQDRLFLNKQNKMDENTNFEDFYNLNDDIVESLCKEIEFLLNRSYEMNDIYNDEEKDTKIPTKRSKELNNKIENLKKKYSNFDLMYDDLNTDNKELKEEITALKQGYEYELVTNRQLHTKFAQCFRIFLPDIKNSEEKKKYFADIFNQINDDISKELKGEKPKYIPKYQTKEEDHYNQLRRIVETEMFKDTDIFNNHDGLFVDSGVFSKHITAPLYFKKSSKLKEEEKKFTENRVNKKIDAEPKSEEYTKLVDVKKTYKYLNGILRHSVSQTLKISPTQVIYMKERFEELFGTLDGKIYPQGFNHLSSLDKYQLLYPNSNLQEYEKQSKKYIC